MSQKNYISSHKKALEILRKNIGSDMKESSKDVLDLLQEFGNTTNAILYSFLFVPSFVVFEGSVILDDGTFTLPDDFVRAKGNWVKSLEELESSFNWREIPYLFSSRDESLEEYHILAELISQSWRGQLQIRFPEKEFMVEVLSSKKTGGGVGVGFREKKLISRH